MNKRMIKRYSEAFKRQVVNEYEDGRSAYELNRKYGIKGGNTIKRWVKKYGRAGFRSELMVIQRPGEREREEQLIERLQELEAAVTQLALEKIVLESSLAEAEKLLGKSIKKKPGRPSSSDATDTD